MVATKEVCSLSRLRGRAGVGVLQRWGCRNLRRISPRGESPHPPRAGRCFASPGARRPLPQAGEVQRGRG
ncbi:hypothetical protein NK6_3612 [Bradyrhizobium diazoefficiens]|uniref:Uncharacterized protein n=1 Tax=Bradyrhizobium diazoefficiens TaxID=1355477 RepID=A0A0E4BPK7_9BRAD|nr:hypothetical protein NK6_3612 [Bradyrhizobium diazoefficiens]